MNIQLFLENQEVELTQSVSFPLNKSYENLYNPTDILVEYSKSINIPITSKNNKILGYAYRLDKVIYDTEGVNIGLYLNPLKRIPFKLLYNNTLILDGYAKFVSATKSDSEAYYTMNLIGKLGDIFNELKSVVTSESKLGDLNRKYLITEADYLKTDYQRFVDAEFAEKSWGDGEYWKTWDPYGEQPSDISHTDVFGLAPAHRGLYPNFESSKIQTDATTIVEMSEYLNEKWSVKNPNYTITGASDVVGDGFKDYQMKEFRAYQLKPYMYFSHLMRIFVDKCKLLTDYTIELDKDWFNLSNPYWSKLCYMFDYLENSNPNVQSGVKSYLADGDYTENAQGAATGNKYELIFTNSMKSEVVSGSSSGYIIAPFDINFGCHYDDTIPADARNFVSYVNIHPATIYMFNIEIHRRTNSTGDLEKIGTYKFWTSAGDIDSPYEEYNSENKLQINDASGSTIMSTKANFSFPANYYVTIPQIPVDGDFQYGMVVYVDVTAENAEGFVDGKNTYPVLYVYSNSYHTGPMYDSIFHQNTYPVTQNNGSMYASFTDLNEIKDWKTNTPVSLETFYQKDTPLFDVILQYTKMFALHWDIDYLNKKINLKTRKSLFKNYTIEDWNDKIDKTKEFVIEPINFAERYAVFNYTDTEGYIYSNYKTKYGVNFGEKRLNTGYEFNTSEKDLFKDINPTSVSSKSYVNINQLREWDANSILKPEIEQCVLLDYESEDEKQSIALNNWCFRLDNTDELYGTYYLTNDSNLMAANSVPCYYSREYLDIIDGNSSSPDASVYAVKKGLPQFSIAGKFDDTMYGMVFNLPNEDYTYNTSVTEIGNNDIYNQFWRDYMNERYCSQNKKVTAYIKLSLNDFHSFKFNKFITIDNQLFMVNKIVDFNMDKNTSTKVELVQIQNPNSFTNKTFEIV